MQLIVVAYRLSEQSHHYYNELLGYMEAARSLGLSARALVPWSVTPEMARALDADAVLEPLVEMAPYNADNPFASAWAYTSQARNLGSLWTALASHDLQRDDLVVFTAGQPAVIAGIGTWLAARPRRRRPSVFFRIVGDEIMDSLTAPSPSGALFFHLACSDLRKQPGQERVFFLGSSATIVRRASRAGDRRVFATAIPKHLAFPPGDASRRPARPTVYIHLNQRSAPFLGGLADIISSVRADGSDVDFIVKPSGLSADALRFIEAELGAIAEILPANQDPQEYLRNFQRCTVVVLPYEAKPYETLSSGVFVEALSSGKPVVVPAQTLMAQELAEGRAAGTMFERATAESVVAALHLALERSRDLAIAAEALSSGVRSENSSRRYVERMIALRDEKPDMTPRYVPGEAIDFTDVADSRCFMREGWGETESWGTWTVAHRACLSFKVAKRRDLAFQALVQPLLTERHPKLVVTVFAAQREVARWEFDARMPDAGSPQWWEAPIGSSDIGRADGVLEISFAIDAPRSPLSEGLADDGRMLGIGVHRLLLS